MLVSSARRRAVGVAVTAILACLLAVPSAALAAPVRVQTLAASVDEHGPGTDRTLVVSAELAPGTKLPTTVDVPVPAGAKPSWVGEILGGDVSGDPAAKYTVKPGKDGDLVTVSLTKSLVAQVEVGVPGAGVVGGRYGTSASLRVPYAVGEALVVLRAPSDAGSVKYSSGMAPSAGEQGFSQFTLRRGSPKPGSTLAADVSFTGGTYPAAEGGVGTAGVAGSADAPGSRAAADSSQGLAGLWVVVGVIAAVALVAIVRRRRSGVAAADGEDDTAPDEARPSTDSGADTEPEAQATSAPSRRLVAPKTMVLVLAALVVAGGVWLAVAAVKPPVKAGEYTQEGGVQRLAIDTSKGDFNPGDFKVKAGVPVELEFGPGRGCTARITIPGLNIDQDLSKGAVIKLPALKAGNYSYNCGSGSPSGQIVAE